MRKIYTYITILLFVIPFIYAADNIIYREGDGIKFETDVAGLAYKFSPENISCQYRYCKSSIEVWTPFPICIDYNKLTSTLPYSLYVNIDKSWQYSGEIYECECVNVLDEMTNETYCNYPDRQYICDTEIEDCKAYDTKKDYCFNTTKVYTQEYYNYQKGQFCTYGGYKSIPAYFIADKHSKGKFDISMEYGLKTYTIDPYWITGTSQWENGTYNYTYEATTGELVMNDSVEYPNNGNTDFVFDMTGNVLLMHLNNDSSFGESDTHAYDFSGNGNNGTISGPGDFDYTTKMLGAAALEFTGDGGTEDDIVISEFYDFNNTNPYTLVAWVNLDDKGGTNHFLITNQEDTGSGQPDRFCGMYMIACESCATADTIAAQAKSCTDNTHVTSVYGDTDIVGTGWHMVAVTMDALNNANSTDFTLYVDGEEESATVYDDDLNGENFDPDYALSIGNRDAHTYATAVDGHMDEVAIFNRSLSAEEIKNLYSVQRSNYLSEIIDTGATRSIDNITFYLDSAYNNYELPNNLGTENNSYYDEPFDMTGNILLMHLNNESGSGTVAVDSSGNGNNGTIEDGVWNCTSKKLGDCSMTFNDTAGGIAINDAGIQPADSSNQYTACAWWYATAFDDYDTIISSVDAPGTTYWIMGVGASAQSPQYQFRFAAKDGTDAVGSYTGEAASLNTWYHTCLVLDGTTLNSYVNGESTPVSIPTNVDLDNVDPGVDINIGQDEDNAPSREFEGQIDEVVIYNRTLTTTEIENLYKRGAMKFNITVRSCDDASCSGENWTDNVTVCYESPCNLSVPNNQYIQYMPWLYRTEATTLSPELVNVSIGYESTIVSNVTFPSFDFTVSDYGSEWARFEWLTNYSGVNCNLTSDTFTDINLSSVLLGGTINELEMYGYAQNLKCGTEYTTACSAVNVTRTTETFITEECWGDNMVNFYDVLFILHLICVIGITILKIRNVLKNAEGYGYEWIFISFFGLLFIWGIGLIIVLTHPLLAYGALMQFSNILLGLSTILFIVEIFLMAAKIGTTVKEPYNPTKN